MCTRATMTWLPFSLFQHPIMNKTAHATGADGENGQLPTHALPPHRSIFSWRRQKARSLKGCYRLLKLFFPGVIFTPGLFQLYCYAGAWSRLNQCGVGSDMARKRKLSFARCHVAWTRQTRVHWVKSKGKTFHLCARIVSYFTSNVRHSNQWVHFDWAPTIA